MVQLSSVEDLGQPDDVGQPDGLDQPNSLDQPERLIELLELERQQVAAELHDGLLPYLFAAAANISSLRRVHPEANQQLEEVAAWIDQSREAARQLMGGFAISPDVAIDPLVTAKEFLASVLIPCGLAQFGEASPQEADKCPVKVVWKCFDDADDQSALYNRLSEPSATAVHRIVVELVRNAVRHAEANKIEVSCQSLKNGDGHSESESFVVEVFDDGNGFDLGIFKQASTGGMRWMRGRAELAGLDLSFVYGSIGAKRSGPTQSGCGMRALLRGSLNELS